jgi:hypothetical protein
MPQRARALRHALLLSAAMKNGHARRTKTSATWRKLTGRQALWAALIVLPVALVLPTAWFVYGSHPRLDEIEKIIRQAGFDPLLPPNRLRGPGALYEVDGGLYRKVCDIDMKLLTGKLQKSPTESQFRQKLERGEYSLAGDFVKTLNAKLSGGRVTSVEIKLTDVAISEIAMSDLSAIEDHLLRQKNCDGVVQKLLKANKKICAGYAALSATTVYKVNVASNTSTDAKSEMPVANAVQQALHEHTNAVINVRSVNEFTGDNLFYGIQLSDLCITPGDAIVPSVLPPLPDGNATEPVGRVSMR